MSRLALAATIVVAALSAMPDTAAAQRLDEWRAAAALRYDLSFRQRTDDAGDGSAAAASSLDLDRVALAGLGLRALAGPQPIGLAVGVDVHAGAGLGGGFAYDANLYAFGLGARLGRHGAVAIITGVGASGVTDRLPAAVQVPVEAWAELALGGRVRLAAWGRAAWISFADAREHGAPSAPFGDELAAGVALRLGRRFHDWGLRSGNGWFLGLEYTEQRDAAFLGVTAGYAIDVATE